MDTSILTIPLSLHLIRQAILLGPAIAPVIGGVTAHYYSWRVMQLGLFLFAFTCLIFTIFLQPETSQPGARGVDKARAKGDSDRLVFLNPFSSLGLLRSPNIALPVCGVNPFTPTHDTDVKYRLWKARSF
jgi:MFS family permease